MSKDDLEKLHKLFGLCLIKDDPNDDCFDTLYKISKLSHELLMSNDADYRKQRNEWEKQRVEIEAWDENERYDLWKSYEESED